MTRAADSLHLIEVSAPAGDLPPAECTIRLRVRYPECDPMGLLHHARFVEYFELGRTELLRLAGLAYRDLEERGVLLVVAQLSIRYRAPVRYDDVVSLRTRLVRMTRARVEHEYAMQVEGRLCCEGRTTLACVDRAGQLQLIPDEIYNLAGARPVDR